MTPAASRPHHTVQRDAANPNSKIVVVDRPGQTGFDLKRTFSIAILKDRNTYIASFENFEVFGFGDSETEAVKDFLIEFCELYNDLEANQDQLNPASEPIWKKINMFLKKRF
jgi:hypothetical protein